MRADPISVLLGADGLIPPRTGIGRLTLEIARQLVDRDTIADFALLAGGEVRPRGWIDDLLADGDAWSAGAGADRPAGPSAVRQVAARVAPLRRMRNLLRRARLERAARRLGGGSSAAVVYHEPNLISAPYDGPTVVTVNDLAWRYDASMHPAERVRWIERNLPRVLADATRLVAVSEFTAAEMRRELGVAPGRIAVVPEAAAAIFRPLSAAEAAPSLQRSSGLAAGLPDTVSAGRRRQRRLGRGPQRRRPRARQRGVAPARPCPRPRSAGAGRARRRLRLRQPL
jgi:Glycosyltransferase Family 4